MGPVSYMVNKKILTEFSDEELIELLQNNPTSSETQIETLYDNDVINFVTSYKLKPGDRPTAARLIYTLYLDWSHEKIPEYKFFQIFNKMFIRKEDDKRCYYLLKLENYDLFDRYSKIIFKKKTNIRGKKSKAHFEHFLQFFNIHPGKNYIDTVNLFALYDYWQYTKRQGNKLDLVDFGQFCRIYLPFKSEKRKNKMIFWIGISDETLTYINEKKYKEKKPT